MDITALLHEALRQGASDLHLAAGRPPMLRVHGNLRSLGETPLAPEAVQALLQPLLGAAPQGRAQALHDLDFGCEVGGLARCRVHVFSQRAGPAAVLRLVPSAIRGLHSLRDYERNSRRHDCETQKNFFHEQTVQTNCLLSILTTANFSIGCRHIPHDDDGTCDQNATDDERRTDRGVVEQDACENRAGDAPERGRALLIADRLPASFERCEFCNECAAGRTRDALAD